MLSRRVTSASSKLAEQSRYLRANGDEILDEALQVVDELVLVGAESVHVGVVELDRAPQRTHERLGVVGEIFEAIDEAAQQQPQARGVGIGLAGQLAQGAQLGGDVRQGDRLQGAALAELLLVHAERPLGGLTRVGQLIEKAGAMEVLDRRDPARIGVGAQVAPLHELPERVGESIHWDVPIRLGAGECLVEVLGAQVHDESPLRGDELAHHPPVQRDVGCREVGERPESGGLHIRAR